MNEIRNITDIKVAALNEEIRIKTGKLENLERMMATESQQLSKKKEALSKLREELSSLQQKCSSLETQLEKSERRNETLEVLLNPRHARTAGVTVLGLCVCVCVCLSSALLALQVTRWRYHASLKYKMAR